MPGGLSPNAVSILSNVYDQTHLLAKPRSYVEAGILVGAIGATGGTAAYLGGHAGITTLGIGRIAAPLLTFSPHALERMSQRGVSMGQVQSIIQNIQPFEYFHEGIWKSGYYDPISKIFVARVDKLVRTVIANVKPQYVENLKRAAQ